MSTIHHTALVHPTAELGSNVIIGPYSIIEQNVKIGNATEIRSNVVVGKNSVIGAECLLHHSVVVGTEPQDLKYKGEETQAIIGDRTVLREFVTVNRATTYSYKTIVGSDCLIMAYCHIAHDCVVGNHVIMANATQLAGHVTIDDWANIGGGSLIIQFLRVGKHAMTGGGTKVVKDIPPFIVADGAPARSGKVNKIGLMRRGFEPEVIKEIEKFYAETLFGSRNPSDGLQVFIDENQEYSNEIQYAIEFFQTTKKGITLAKKR